MRFKKPHKDLDIQEIQREIEDKVVAVDKNGDIVIKKDVRCRSLYVEGDSIYIGGVKWAKPGGAEDTYYLQYNKSANKFEYKPTATPITESVQDIIGAMFSGNTETLIAATYQDSDGTIDLVVDEASIDHDSISGALPSIASKTDDYTASFNELLLCDGTFIVTMPDITSDDLGKRVQIQNEGTGIITGDGNGNDTFYGEKTIQCIANATLTLMAVTLTTWILV